MVTCRHTSTFANVKPSSIMSTPCKQDYLNLNKYAMEAILDGKRSVIFDAHPSALHEYAMGAMVDEPMLAMLHGSTVCSVIPSDPVDQESINMAMTSILPRSGLACFMGQMDVPKTTRLTTRWGTVLSPEEPWTVLPSMDEEIRPSTHKRHPNDARSVYV
jgi:hypothetical protein